MNRANHRHRRQAIASIALSALLVQSFVGASGLAAPQTPSTARPATAPAQPSRPAPQPVPAAADPGPVDGGWPRTYPLASGGDIVVYQPQAASWTNEKDLVAYSAVSYRDRSGQPALGTVKLEATTTVALSDRLVGFQNMRIVEANFQSLPRETLRDVVTAIDNAIPPDDRVIALDRLLANIDKSQIIPRNVDGIKADPPTIFFSKTAAVIVNLDGEPIWSPIAENDLKYAVNTNWDLFQHEPTKQYFLLNGNSWLKATELTGTWSPAGTLPESFKKLPADENWNDVRRFVPGTTVRTAPRVFVSTTPAELILLRGEPSYLAVAGTNLLWVSNTDSDVFRLGRAGQVYYLVAGRWFSAPDFTGPWTFATPSLPEDFKKISLEHERSRVLASVPGTDQAAEAVLLAGIPQTARVNRRELKAPDVAFQGEPKFAPIEPTTVQRAENTDKDVFKIGNDYYMCFQGVWFTSKGVTGPWEVATSVPDVIYKIPASSPSHHVTYVTIEEDDDDDEWVMFAAAAGYTGMMIAWGCTVWGTGWYYPPYWGYGGFYPYYYPHFPTYGYSAWYNPWTGAYGRSAAVYGPYGGAGIGARYNPRTGTYARGAAAWGPYGARGVAQAYNPRTGTYAQTRQGSNVYGSWGSTTVQRGDDWAKTNRYTNRQTGTTTRTIRTDDGAAVTRRGPDGGRVAVGDGGNVYAGKDGNVYRRQDGTWQKYENGGWSNTDRQPAGRPTPQTADRGSNTPGTGSVGTTDRSGGSFGSPDRSTFDQLNRDSAARTEGSRRSNDYGSYRGGSGTSGMGSYRGGGGMRGGGGGRRR